MTPPTGEGFEALPHRVGKPKQSAGGRAIAVRPCCVAPLLLCVRLAGLLGDT